MHGLFLEDEQEEVEENTDKVAPSPFPGTSPTLAAQQTQVTVEQAPVSALSSLPKPKDSDQHSNSSRESSTPSTPPAVVRRFKEGEGPVTSIMTSPQRQQKAQVQKLTLTPVKLASPVEVSATVAQQQAGRQIGTHSQSETITNSGKTNVAPVSMVVKASESRVVTDSAPLAAAAEAPKTSSYSRTWVLGGLAVGVLVATGLGVALSRRSSPATTPAAAPPPSQSLGASVFKRFTQS